MAFLDFLNMQIIKNRQPDLGLPFYEVKYMLSTEDNKLDIFIYNVNGSYVYNNEKHLYNSSEDLTNLSYHYWFELNKDHVSICNKNVIRDNTVLDYIYIQLLYYTKRENFENNLPKILFELDNKLIEEISKQKSTLKIEQQHLNNLENIYDDYIFNYQINEKYKRRKEILDLF